MQRKENMKHKKQPILNIDEVEKELNKAEQYEDIENQGQFIQTIYLGSILSLTPSGKIYTPWANSNLDLCTRCEGKGNIRNKHKSIKKVDAIDRKIRRVANDWVKPYATLTKRQQQLIDKLRKIREHYDEWKTCPECYGMCSLEARLDEDWWKQLESELEPIDAWYHGSEGDGCDIMISRVAADQTEE